MGKSSPAAPDYKGAALAEASASKDINTQQTWANRPNQYTPYGQLEWEASQGTDPSTGKPITQWNQYESLSPELQKIYDDEVGLQGGKTALAGGMMGRMSDEFGQTMDWGQFGDQAGVDPQARMGDPEMWRNQAYENMYGRSTRSLDPQYEQSEATLRSKLLNQGLTEGDQAYDTAMENFNRDKTDAYDQARSSAQLYSGQEGQRMQGMERTGIGYNQDTTFREADYSNKLRQEAMKEEMTKRGFSLNEINALISGQQVQNPTFEGYSGANKSATPQLNAAAINQGNFDQQAAQMKNEGIQNMMGGAMSVAGMFSDRRLKTNIERIGTLKGYPYYSFDYIWGESSFGVMSDEINPEAVVKHHTGYDMVDYSKIERTA